MPLDRKADGYLDSFLLWGPVSCLVLKAYPRRPLGPPDRFPEDTRLTSRTHIRQLRGHAAIIC